MQILANRFVVSKFLVLLIFCLLIQNNCLSQPYSAFVNFDSALVYKEILHSFTFDSTCNAIPNDVSLLMNLEEITILNADIGSIPPALFELPRLRRLSIVGASKLNVVDVFEGICNSKTIEGLFIREVPIDRIPLLRNQCSTLKDLFLVKTGLVGFGNEIEAFPNIETLSIAGNPNCLISESIIGLKKLKTLVLSDCQLDSLPSSVAKLTGLQELLADNNPSLNIDILAEQIVSFDRLKTLNVSRCNIEHLPANLSKLKQMEDFWVESNYLTSISEWISCWKYLRRIEASNNQINYVPDALWKMNHLLYVDLSFNRISEITSTQIDAPLIQLYLEGNTLDEPTMERLSRWFPGWIDVLH